MPQAAPAAVQAGSAGVAWHPRRKGPLTVQASVTISSLTTPAWSANTTPINNYSQSKKILSGPIAFRLSIFVARDLNLHAVILSVVVISFSMFHQCKANGQFMQDIH